MGVDINSNEHTRNMEFSKEISDLIVLINERQQKHDELLNTILEQVKKTNGRVNAIEHYKEMVADPCIQDAKTVKNRVAHLELQGEKALSSISTFKTVVYSIGGVLIAGSITLYSYWVKDLSEKVSADVMAKIEQVYTFE